MPPNHQMTILEHTFIHLGLVSSHEERSLWGEGVRTIDDLIKRSPGCRDEKVAKAIAKTKRALEERDHVFFAKALPKDQLFRVAVAYPQETAFLDIETTGLSRTRNQITIVGWTLGEAFKVIVYGRDDPAELYDDLAKSKALVTFNGTSFDLPFLKSAFPDLGFPLAHVDLRYLCKSLNLVGGQKSIERQIGLCRHEGQGDGLMAVALWNEYKYGRGRGQRAQALKDLIIYNFADVNSMKHIFDACLEKMADQGHLPLRYDHHFRALCFKPDFYNSFPFSLEPF
ncbi:MAG: ribonuclease H-like domain-containing protein [Deltaproteobacteria bacterium]|nr:ribonuclease H-like domain-containing protein [Deltaproteobacteria bacterium]